MMFKAEIEVRTVDEFNAFALFMSNIAQMRGVLRPQPQVEPAPTPQHDEPTVEEVAAQIEEKEAVVGKIGTPDATITDAKLIEAFQMWLTATRPPMPQVVELLARYDATKVGQITQERRREFLEELIG